MKLVLFHLPFLDFDTALAFHIALVAYQNNGQLCCALVDLKDLFMEFIYLFKGFVVVDGVYQDEGVTVRKKVWAQVGILILPGSVQNFGKYGFPVYFQVLGKLVLNGWGVL